MVVDEYKEFIIKELEKRNLPTNGTMRVLETLYQQAVEREQQDNEQSFEQNDENIEEESDEKVDKDKQNEQMEQENQRLEQDYVQEEDINWDCFLENDDIQTIHKSDQDQISEFTETPSDSIESSSEFNETNSESIETDSDIEVVEGFADKIKIKQENYEIEQKKLKEEQNIQSDGDESDLEQKLFFGNFPYKLSENEIYEIFRQYGRILDLSLVRDGSKSRGFGFVIFKSKKNANKALKEIHGTVVEDRIVRVERARKKIFRPSKKKTRKNKSKKKKKKKSKKAAESNKGKASSSKKRINNIIHNIF